MRFEEILQQAIDILRRRGRVSYGALRRQFELDNEYLADLKGELIDVLEVAADQDGKMLVWAAGERSGEAEKRGSGEPSPNSPQPPIPNPQSLVSERR
jgi:hypothetical protein